MAIANRGLLKVTFDLSRVSSLLGSSCLTALPLGLGERAFFGIESALDELVLDELASSHDTLGFLRCFAIGLITSFPCLAIGGITLTVFAVWFCRRPILSGAMTLSRTPTRCSNSL